MRSDEDTEWTAKLQPAVLAANTQRKRSTGFTPFYLMFGRDYDSSNLLNLVTSSKANAESPSTCDPESPSAESISIAPDEDDIYEPPQTDDDWVKEMKENRDSDRTLAIHSISKEQKVQKTIFDRKLKRKR